MFYKESDRYAKNSVSQAQNFRCLVMSLRPQ
jgi:hypothetical protein